MAGREKPSDAERAKAERAFYGQFERYVRDAYPEGCVTAAEAQVMFRDLVGAVRRRAEQRAVLLRWNEATAAAAKTAKAETAALPGLQDTQRLDAAMDFLRQHFRTATLTDVAAASGWSEFHFHRRFTKWAGRTPKAIMAELQVEHAKTLMVEGELELAEVAVRCGFAQQSHLTTRFKMLVGTTPTRWLRQRKAESLRVGDAGVADDVCDTGERTSGEPTRKAA